MNKPVILLSFKQLCFFGVHVGHNISNYVFLSSWIFLGWYKNIFIINLYKTFLNLRFAVSLFNKCAIKRRPVIFVCIRSVFGPLVARYGFACGEVFNIYWWIFGTLTNFYRILGWNQLLVRLMMKDKYKLRFKDKKRLASFFGLVMHRRRLPAAGFVTSVLDNLGPVDEFLSARLPCVGIVDSNVPSWNILMPVPGNDDSAICVNFYCYLIARSLLAGKVLFVSNWRRKIKKVVRKDLVKFRNITNFIYVYSNLFRNYSQSNFFKQFNKIRQAEIPVNISITETINFWLQESEIVKDFSIYRDELFLLVPEEKFSEIYDINYSLI